MFKEYLKQLRTARRYKAKLSYKDYKMYKRG